MYESCQKLETFFILTHFATKAGATYRGLQF